MPAAVEINEQAQKFQEAYENFFKSPPAEAKDKFKSLREAFGNLPKKEGGMLEEIEFESPKMKPILKGLTKILESKDEPTDDDAGNAQNTAKLIGIFSDLKEGKNDIGTDGYATLSAMLDDKNFNPKDLQEAFGLEHPFNISKEKDGTITIEVHPDDMDKFTSAAIDKEGKKAEKPEAAKEGAEAGDKAKGEDAEKKPPRKSPFPSFNKLGVAAGVVMIASVVFPPLLVVAPILMAGIVAIGVIKAVTETLMAVFDFARDVVSGVKTVAKGIKDLFSEALEIGGKVKGLFSAIGENIQKRGEKSEIKNALEEANASKTDIYKVLRAQLEPENKEAAKAANDVMKGLKLDKESLRGKANASVEKAEGIAKAAEAKLNGMDKNAPGRKEAEAAFKKADENYKKALENRDQILDKIKGDKELSPLDAIRMGKDIIAADKAVNNFVDKQTTAAPAAKTPDPLTKSATKESEPEKSSEKPSLFSRFKESVTSVFSGKASDAKTSEVEMQPMGGGSAPTAKSSGTEVNPKVQEKRAANVDLLTSTLKESGAGKEQIQRATDALKNVHDGKGTYDEYNKTIDGINKELGQENKVREGMNKAGLEGSDKVIKAMRGEEGAKLKPDDAFKAMQAAANKDGPTPVILSPKEAFEAMKAQANQATASVEFSRPAGTAAKAPEPAKPTSLKRSTSEPSLGITEEARAAIEGVKKSLETSSKLKDTNEPKPPVIPRGRSNSI